MYCDDHFDLASFLIVEFSTNKLPYQLYSDMTWQEMVKVRPDEWLEQYGTDFTNYGGD